MAQTGRPPWEPSAADRTLVEHYVAMGYTQDQVAALIGKTKKALQRHCRTELSLGKLRANAKVGGKLFQKCMAGDTTALIFWAKTQMGWKETDRREHTGANGEPMKITVEFVETPAADIRES